MNGGDKNNIMEKQIVLQKGSQIKFLDYFIKNSLNNDGLVLYKQPGYECHLGNYGLGTQENVDMCKKYALIYFMIARPEIFASSLANKIAGHRGTYNEFFKLKHCLEDIGIDMPQEITDGDGINSMIYFKNKPLWEI